MGLAFTLFEIGTEPWWDTVDALRAVAIEQALKIPLEDSLVLTNVLADGDERAENLITGLRQLAMQRNSRLLAITLTADESVRLERMASPERRPPRLTDPDIGRWLPYKYNLMSETTYRRLGTDSLTIDTTLLSADQAVAAIVEHVARTEAVG
jgi:hypothetical protein